MGPVAHLSSRRQQEIEMIKLKIGEKEFELKYTLEAWKKLKSENDITPSNFQVKLEEDMAGTLSALIYYGLLPKERETISVESLDEQLEFNSLDIVSKAIMAGLPEKVKKSTEGGQEEPVKK